MAFTEAQILEALTVSMSAAYTKGLGAISPQWNRVATQVPSAGSSNFYGWLKDLPAIKEWLTARQLVEVGSHGYQILNKTFESSIVIKREDVEDDHEREGDPATRSGHRGPSARGRPARPARGGPG